MQLEFFNGEGCFLVKVHMEELRGSVIWECFAFFSRGRRGMLFIEQKLKGNDRERNKQTLSEGP